MIKIGVIGYGYWGPNLMRNFNLQADCQVVALCDANENRLARARPLYSNTRLTTNYRDLIEDPSIDAIVIATPVSTHYPLADAALSAGKHVMVEKPICESVPEAELLIEKARSRNLILMVGHTFVYHGAVRKIKELLNRNELGKLNYYDSMRVNLGLFQRDVNVLWDLAVHDLSIIDYLFEQKPVMVSATGGSHVQGHPENIAFLTLFFTDDFIAHVNVNWMAPVKLRNTLISGDQKMIVYNDLVPGEVIKVYDNGLDVDDNPVNRHRAMIGYRTGDVWSPKVEPGEALQVETGHFLSCIANGQAPISDGLAGLRVLKTLEAAEKSMRQRGVPVEIE